MMGKDFNCSLSPVVYEVFFCWHLFKYLGDEKQCREKSALYIPTLMGEAGVAQCGPGSIPAGTRRHRWVEIVVGFHTLLQEGFSPGIPKATFPSSNSIWNARTRINEFFRALRCYVGK